MKIIGINYLSESSVCLIDKGKIISSISEERINRKKNWYGLPFKTINYILNKNNLNIKDIDYFVTREFQLLIKVYQIKRFILIKLIKLKFLN